MIRKLLDFVAPVRPVQRDRGYRRLLRWASLAVTNRRWAPLLCALALGFGIFAGVAIGPGASGTFANGTPPVVEIPGLAEGGGESEAPEEEATGGGLGESDGGEAESFPTESESSEFPFAESEPEESFEEEGEEPLPEGKGNEKEPADEPEEEAQVLTGVVVHANPAAGSYTLVETGGVLNAVHASQLPAPKTKVQVPVRILANGTYAEAGARKKTGAASGAKLAGIVTFVDANPAAPGYAVSKRGTSVLVRLHPDPTGVPPQLPQLGAYATVDVEIEAPPSATVPGAAPASDPAASAGPGACAPDPAVAPAVPKPKGVLWQRSVDADGAPFASSDFEGIVMAVCPGQLLLSGDDMREAGGDVLFTVPGSIDTSKLAPGDSVAVTAAIEAGGTLKLSGLASDERTKGAEDVSLAQGDLVPQTTK
jgi:hypothetical protein